MPLHPLRFAASAIAGLGLLAGCASAPSGTATPPGEGSPSPAVTASTAQVTTSAATSTTAGPARVTEPAPQGLPRGGTEFFPRYRLFGYVGYPGDKVLGRLGEGDVEDRMAELAKQSDDEGWAQGREIMPVMELIVSLAVATPEADGLYRLRMPDSAIASWLNVARRHKAILLLDIQPGRADFMSELKHVEKWLKEPDVGVALDPEWAVDAGQVPGKVFGNTSGKELNACAAYLSDIVKANGLPEKMMVYHVLHPTIVRNEADLKKHEGVVALKSVDGIGSPAAKVDTWEKVVATTPKDIAMGFKLFFTEDVTRGGRLMTRAEVLALSPEPEYVMFE